MNNELNYRKLLIELREKHNLSQEELADKLEVSRQTVARWESGKNNPAANQIAKLCKIFDLNPATLWEEGSRAEEEKKLPAEEEIPVKTEISAEEQSLPLSPFTAKKNLPALICIATLIALAIVGLVITISYAIKDSQFDSSVTALIILLPQNTPMVTLSALLFIFIAILTAILIYLVRRKNK